MGTIPPYSYILKYTGQDEIVKTILEQRNIEGEYVNQKSVQKGSPYYLKEKPSWLYLVKNEGGWQVSQYLMSEDYIIMQKGRNDYLPLEHSVWTLKHGTLIQEIPSGIALKPFYKEGDLQEHATEAIGTVEEDVMEDKSNTTERKDSNSDSKVTNNTILSVCLAVVSVVLILVVIRIYLPKMLHCQKEEPKMEENLDYGEYEEYYDEHNNRIVDTNDYYE